MKPKSFTKKRNNYNQHCKNNKNAKKRKFSQSNHNINESPQPQKRKLNKCIQNIFEKNRQLRKEIYLIKQERDKYKKERDYYCNRIQKCLKIVRGTKNINQFQNNNQEQVRIYTETQSDEANDNDNNKIFANDNPIEIVLLLLEKYPQIDRWLNSMEYHSVVTTSHTHSIHLLTYLMNKQPQFTQVIEVIQQQLTCTASTTNLSAYISPAPIHWQITSCTDEKKEGKWRIKLKVIKNPLKEALLRIGTKRFNLDDMFDILADVEDNDDIKRTNTARRRLREELFLIRGCYEVSKAEFDASDFVNSFHDDAGSDGGSNHDDICYECGNCGELVCCDGCPHAFHLLCVGLSTVPNDKWFCNQCICMYGKSEK